MPSPALWALVGKAWVLHFETTPMSFFYLKKKNLSVCSFFHPAQTQHCSHIIPQSSLHVLLFSRARGWTPPALIPPSFCADTVEKQVSDRERQAEEQMRGGRALLLCCWAANLRERKSSPDKKRAPSFVQGSTRGLFLLWWYQPPHLCAFPPLLCLSPQFLLLSLFFLLLLSCPWIYPQKASPDSKKHHKVSKKCFYKFIQTELSRRDLTAVGKLVSGLENCHGNHTTSCSGGSQDSFERVCTVYVPLHVGSLFRHFQMTHILWK